MLEFIERLLQAAGITQAKATMDSIPATGVVALPSDFTERDLEKYLKERRRQRGVMNTHIEGDFGVYVAAALETGARIFVNETEMSATAVLNLGTPEHPGHADNLAVLTCKKTAAYLALGANASGQAKTQVQIAEFLEDWSDLIVCLKGAGPEAQAITNSKAIAAVRAITIEGLKRVRNEEQSLSANKTTLESITASSEEPIPTLIRFKCVPYVGFAEREFSIRLGILTSDKPALVLRVIKQEEHDEQMGNELAGKLRAAVGDIPPVLLGKYTVR